MKIWSPDGEELSKSKWRTQKEKNTNLNDKNLSSVNQKHDKAN